MSIRRFSMAVTATCSGLSGLAASAVAAGIDLPGSDKIDAIGRWPLTVVLGAVCCFLAWLMYRQACMFGEHLSDMGKAISALDAGLRERPCIRDPKNN